jgi:hypothetical protein
MSSATLPSNAWLHRGANLLKTGLLLAALSALVLVLGQRLGGPQASPSLAASCCR